MLGRKSTQGQLQQIGAATPDAVSMARPGPWGNIEYVPITIAAPEEYLPVEGFVNTPVEWVFAGFTPQKMAAFLDVIDLTAEQREEMLSPGVLKLINKGVELCPPAKLSLSLSAKAREQLCAQMAQFPENGGMLEVISAKSFEDHFVKSGVSESTVAMVRKFGSAYRSYLIFPDLPYVFGSIPTYSEKLNLLKAFSRQSTFLVKLHVTPDSDINALANYYGKACWVKDVKPILESLERVPGGARIDFVHLMPPLPTSLLYTFPLPNGPQATNIAPDCHWTSMNFFRDPPDPRYSDPAYTSKILQGEFYEVPSDPRYGDILMFCKPNGESIHSAIVLFDNIVFTKNGPSCLQPWKLATTEELLELYSYQTTPDKPLQMKCYRSKYY